MLSPHVVRHHKRRASEAPPPRRTSRARLASLPEGDIINVLQSTHSWDPDRRRHTSITESMASNGSNWSSVHTISYVRSASDVASPTSGTKMPSLEKTWADDIVRRLALQAENHPEVGPTSAKASLPMLSRPGFIGSAYVCSLLVCVLFAVLSSSLFSVSAVGAGAAYGVGALGIGLLSFFVASVTRLTDGVAILVTSASLAAFLVEPSLETFGELCLMSLLAVAFHAAFSKTNKTWLVLLAQFLVCTVAVMVYALDPSDLDVADDLANVGSRPVLVLALLSFAVASLALTMFGMVSAQLVKDYEDMRAGFYRLKNKHSKFRTDRLDRHASRRMQSIIGTPAESVVQTLRKFVRDYQDKLSDKDMGELRQAIRLVGSSKLYQANPAELSNAGTSDVDDDTQKWVLDQLVNKSIEFRHREMATPPDVGAPRDSVVSNPTQPPPTLPGAMKRASSLTLLPSVTEPVADLLEKAGEWTFDVFELDRLTEGHALYVLASHLFVYHQLIEELDLDAAALGRFLSTIEAGYISNSYHSAIHAADVLQAFHYLLVRGGLGQYVDSRDILAGIIACVVHDFQHPGVNNNFLITVGSPLATTFNDISVLENYHVSEAFKVLQRTDCNFCAQYPREAFLQFRRTVIEMVLATDMAQHAGIMGAIKARLSVGPLDGQSTEDRLMLLKMAIKFADVSNPGRPSSLATAWTNRVVEEFFAQGDKERERGIPVSPFMDREHAMVPKSQVGFISFVVLPLAENWAEALESGSEVIRNLQDNLEYWRSKVPFDETMPGLVRPAGETLPPVSAPSSKSHEARSD